MKGTLSIRFVNHHPEQPETGLRWSIATGSPDNSCIFHTVSGNCKTDFKNGRLSKVVLLIFLFNFGSFTVFPESPIEENTILEKLEFNTSSSTGENFFNLMQFLAPKWNLDKKYAPHVLGFMYGYLSHNGTSKKDIIPEPESFNNQRLVAYIELMMTKNDDELYNRLLLDKYDGETFAWYSFFASQDVAYLQDIFDFYAERNSDAETDMLVLRYYFERHEDVKSYLIEYDTNIYNRVNSRTYEEMKQILFDRIRKLRK